MPNNPLRDGIHDKIYRRNRKKVLATQSICGICGKPVDFSKRYPHPLSATVDHIIPLSLGGHPSDLDNLQLAHNSCNRQKSDKYMGNPADAKVKRTASEVRSRRILPLSEDWSSF